MTHQTPDTRVRSLIPLLVGAGLLAACGGRSGLDERPIERPFITSSPEVCDGVDNDLDGQVDEPWMDELGRYLHDEHCGACGNDCQPDTPEVLAASCQDVEGTPLCVATVCAEGYVPARDGGCVPLIDMLCLPCLDDGDCGVAIGAICVEVGEERRCSYPCETGECPEGYACQDGLCLPPGGSCWCRPGSGDFTVACTIENEEADLECLGFALCHDGVLDECAPYAEICDYLDNDCDGLVDEPFVNDFGGYNDIHNCGACGVDCTESPLPEGDLACRGDPAHPQCLLYCEDEADGLDPGDRIDADLIFSNGCECTVTAVDDEAGPIGAVGPELDVNCDGADGVVRRSVYVAPDGDDTDSGTPLYPVQSIAVAIEIAEASLETDLPRPHVFVAAGTYGEVLRVPEGVQIHGGYRRDFLELDPDAYQSVIYTASDEPTPGGAVLIVEEVTEVPTLVEGLMLHGASAPEDSAAAYGVYLRDSTGAVTLRDLHIYPGHGAPGRHGADGEAGSGPSAEAGAGDLPRPAEEDSRHDCLRTSDANTVEGGRGGRNMCDGTDVSGGRGGSASCPLFAEIQPAGRPGNGSGAGRGGRGGVDSHGPITGDRESCDAYVCCGLADFTVPFDMAYAGDGGNGAPGSPGAAGGGCDDSLGTLAGELWTGGTATRGGRGTPGSGGGGGGAGGGAEMDWYPDDCEWADGLGGGGGGGGAGGCGGEGGTPGTSGGPSVGVLVVYQEITGRVDPPILENITIFAGDGGRGGRGGAGGDGGAGGLGGAGGNLPREDQVNPSLAGPTPGAYGGAGGEGGPGGGGGGGCGGSSVGVLVWLDGASSIRPGLADEYRRACDVSAGRPGEGGAGGGGARAGGDGLDGLSEDVLVR